MGNNVNDPSHNASDPARSPLPSGAGETGETNQLPVSAFVVTYNESLNIDDCLSSVAWCNEIVVVDSESTDDTREKARRHTDRIITKPWEGHVNQKGYAMAQSTNDWVFLIDADERVSPALRDAIVAALKGVPDDVAGFRVPRLSRYLGRWIYHGGWYPDYKLRLFRKSRGRVAGEDPHEHVEVDGRVVDLTGDLLHYTYRNLSHQLKTIDYFSDIEANNFRKAGRRPGILRMLFHPWIKFVETYIVKAGFLDGMPGFIISVATAFYVFLKYAKLWEGAHTGSGGTMENRS
jgi:glycosyltransferase involved in cell wall biosynthesis